MIEYRKEGGKSVQSNANRKGGQCEITDDRIHGTIKLDQSCKEEEEGDVEQQRDGLNHRRHAKFLESLV